MYFNETAQAINAIKILDRNFKVLLEQCDAAKKELSRLREENERLKNEIDNVRRKENPEKMA